MIHTLLYGTRYRPKAQSPYGRIFSVLSETYLLRSIMKIRVLSEIVTMM